MNNIKQKLFIFTYLSLIIVFLASLKYIYDNVTYSPEILIGSNNAAILIIITGIVLNLLIGFSYYINHNSSNL